MEASSADRTRLLLLGDARQVHLARWAAYFIDRGWDVLTVSLEESTGFPGRLEHIRMTNRLPHALRYPAAARRVRRIMHRFKPHIVNAHFVPNYGLMATILGFEPWVLSTWGSDIMTDPDKSPFHRWRTRRVLHRVQWVTSDADVMTARLGAFGVDAGKILTFPLGVDTSHFSPRENPPEDGPRVVSNRKLEDVYSVDTIVDAFPGVHELFPSATLVIAGEGTLRTELGKRAEHSIASGSIMFIGAVDHHRMPTLLQENHVYVSMSLSDTTSVSLLEAMACGLFPIVSDIPANREWIVPGENGMLVPVRQPMRLATAIVQAWRDRELREKARERNLDIIRERATWQENMQPVGDLFDRLVDGK